MALSKRSSGELAELESWYVDRSVADPLAGAARGLRDKTICVMGGCGQVGSHVLTKLYELGHAPERLSINDSLSLGRADNLPAPLRQLVDTRTHREFVAAPPPAPDVLIFVGGRSSAPHFRGLGDVLEEIECWKAVLEWCAGNGVRLIFASTSSLAKTRPSVETQRAWPGSLYELTKLMMEEMAIQQAPVRRVGGADLPILLGVRRDGAAQGQLRQPVHTDTLARQGGRSVRGVGTGGRFRTGGADAGHDIRDRGGARGAVPAVAACAGAAPGGRFRAHVQRGAGQAGFGERDGGAGRSAGRARSRR